MCQQLLPLASHFWLSPRVACVSFPSADWLLCSSTTLFSPGPDLAVPQFHIPEWEASVPPGAGTSPSPIIRRDQRWARSCWRGNLKVSNEGT